MKVSLNWIKKYTPVDLSVEDLVARIGAQLGAVEEVTDLRGAYKDILVVQITEAKPHPNADKLNIYQMTDGNEQVQVVSGDRDLQVGDKVAWLAPGTIIPNTFDTATPVIMEARPMRGEMSNGMFGSGKELGFNDDHERVLVLDTDAKPGALLSTAYELDDVIITIENKMFTHRPDCFGLLGVAREVAGILGQSFASPDWYLLEAGAFFKTNDEPLPLSITNDIPQLCPYYQAVVMRDIQIGPSPLLFQSYLKRVGIRPISNVVDVTNYLMYLTGQPLHAFDYDKVAAVDNEHHAAIVIRNPKKGEVITLIDGRTVEPHADAILICSRHRPIAIGGVMGGTETEVDDCTRNIIIEAANFNMYSIRKTSMEHGIFTDAVTRYSKGQSVTQCGVVLGEAVRLMERYASGVLATEFGVEKPASPTKIIVKTHFISERLGLHLQPAHIKRLLENVEMTVTADEEDLSVTPGFWRTDVEIPEDIVEEVGRLQGFGGLPHELPLRTTEAVDALGAELLKSEVRNLLAEAGNNELQTYSFISSSLLQKTAQDVAAAYRLRNALSPELQLIRTSLQPSLLEKVHPNHKSGFDQFGLFEIGKSHNKHDLGEDELPREHLSLSYVFSVEKKLSKAWAGSPYYQVKHVLYYLLRELHISVTYVSLSSYKTDIWWFRNLMVIFEPKQAAVVMHKDIPLGVIGAYKATVRKNFKLPDFIAGFELDLGVVNGIERPTSSYLPLLRFPATEQDICFRVDKAIRYTDLEQAIHHYFSSDQRLRVKTSPLDIYQREEDEARKQITFRVILQSHEKTLTTSEVNAHMAQLAERMKMLFKAEQV